MLNKSYLIIIIGIMSMIVSSIFFYFDSRSMPGFILFSAGFIVVGIGLLMGLFKMMSDK
jgi:hypothetical protein